MKDPNLVRDRAYFRYQDIRRKNKIRWYFRDTVFDYEHRYDEHHWWNGRGMDSPNWLETYIGRTASHNHSCDQCGNPRYHWGKKIVTRKEKLAKFSFKEQLNEFFDDGIEQMLIDWFVDTYYKDE